MRIGDFEEFRGQHRSKSVRLRTLVMLRWFAVLGQTAAILIAIRIYDLQIDLVLTALVISMSVIANLFCIYGYPPNQRLSEREALIWLVFDIVQLNLLLYLTGGLNNPFALLVIAPVTIASTVLHVYGTIFLGALATVLITIVSFYHLPFVLSDGSILAIPVLFQFGFWLAVVIGMVFLSLYTRQVTSEMQAMGQALAATQLALAREQKLTDLGGVVAATAHELGTPLATIKLASGELKADLQDQPDLLEDAMLISEQADRCRDILHSMGQAGKDDLHLRHAPFEAVIREAAEPHMDRGKTVRFQMPATQDPDLKHPVIPRQPEIIHGLRNLIQNAVDFSRSEIFVNLTWTDDFITVQIADDGPGFPQSILGRIGDPYVRRRGRKDVDEDRPAYEGMGLGLFIAKTLLERSGATLNFTNNRAPGSQSRAGQAGSGAVVQVIWPRDSWPLGGDAPQEPLGENQPIAI